MNVDDELAPDPPEPLPLAEFADERCLVIEGLVVSVGNNCARASRTSARAAMKLAYDAAMVWLETSTCSSSLFNSGSLKSFPPLAAHFRVARLRDLPIIDFLHIFGRDFLVRRGSLRRGSVILRPDHASAENDECLPQKPESRVFRMRVCACVSLLSISVCLLRCRARLPSVRPLPPATEHGPYRGKRLEW